MLLYDCVSFYEINWYVCKNVTAFTQLTIGIRKYITGEKKHVRILYPGLTSPLLQVYWKFIKRTQKIVIIFL